MTAEMLEVFVLNDKRSYDEVWAAVRSLRHAMDRAAQRLAKSNADWHDDPDGDPEGYAEYHAHADEQFPIEVRHEAALELVGQCLRVALEAANNVRAD